MFILVAGTGLFVAGQLLSGGYRADSFALALRAVRLSPVEARQERLTPVDPALLDAVAARVPVHATLILVTPSGDGPDRILFHRALAELAPRRVLWVPRQAPTAWPGFQEAILESPAAVSALARRRAAWGVLGVGLGEAPVAGNPELLPGKGILVRVRGAE